MIIVKEAENKAFGVEEPIWSTKEALEWIKGRVWIDSKEALEWIETHTDEIHRKALESCIDYPPDIELEIFDVGYQALIDGEAMTI